MMKLVFCIVIAVAFVWAQDAPAPPPSAPDAHDPHKEPVQILKQDSDVEVDGYSFDFETSDGTARQETGEYKNDTDQQGLLVKGSYQYVAPDGEQISVTFVADKNGYKPTITNSKDEKKPAA